MVLPTRLAFRPVLLATSVAMAAATAAPVRAQGKLEASYVVTLAGLPIGKGRWTIEISEDRYTASASGATSGLLRVFASGDGNSSVRGAMGAGGLVPSAFAANVNADKKSEEFRMTLEGGDVKDFSVSPPLPPNPERVPLTDAHRRGVMDPMSASIMRVPDNADLMGPNVCNRTLSIFDGRMRYDLQLAFKRVDQISAEKGYAGPAVVCGVSFVPLAGHNPQRSAIKYLINLREMEMWLAPISGTRVVVPFRLSIPTPIGLGIAQATEFVSVAQPPRAAAASAKAQ